MTTIEVVKRQVFVNRRDDLPDQSLQSLRNRLAPNAHVVDPEEQTGQYEAPQDGSHLYIRGRVSTSTVETTLNDLGISYTTVEEQHYHYPGFTEAVRERLSFLANRSSYSQLSALEVNTLNERAYLYVPTDIKHTFGTQALRPFGRILVQVNGVWGRAFPGSVSISSTRCSFTVDTVGPLVSDSAPIDALVVLGYGRIQLTEREQYSFETSTTAEAVRYAASIAEPYPTLPEYRIINC